jgi:putative hydrolase of the HAD superfamily
VTLEAGTAVEAVTFDYWNTLVYEERGHLRGRRIEAWTGIFEDVGFAVERERLDAAFDVSWTRYVESWTANEQYQAARAAEDVLEDLGFDVPADVRTQLIDSFGRAGEEAELHLTDGIEDTLLALKDAGIRLGIICDVGMTGSAILREHLIRHQILPLFDHWSFSDEVGAYKPSPVIFEHALEGLGGPVPERVAHVGDIRRTDVAGAKAMGMIAVRYIGVSDDQSQPEPEGDHVITKHAELLDVLGVAVP